MTNCNTFALSTGAYCNFFSLGNTFLKINTFIYGSFVTKGKWQVINILKFIKNGIDL